MKIQIYTPHYNFHPLLPPPSSFSSDSCGRYWFGLSAEFINSGVIGTEWIFTELIAVHASSAELYTCTSLRAPHTHEICIITIICAVVISFLLARIHHTLYRRIDYTV